jgi:hypothetical protein
LTRLYVGSVYKLIFIGLVFFFVPLSILFGLLALIGWNTVQWNGQQLYGLAGLLVSPLIGAVVVGFFTVFLGTACVAGLWLYSKFKPLSLWAKDVTHHANEAA